MITSIDHLNIVVSDLNRAREFFALLGLVEEDSALLEGPWISSIVGLENVKAQYSRLSLPGTPTNIELIQYISPDPSCDPDIGQPHRMGLRHMAFGVDDIDTVVDTLKEHGVEMVGSVQTYPKTGKRLVYFYGPDGILLELAQYKR